MYKISKKLLLITLLVAGFVFSFQAKAAAPFEITKFDVNPKSGALPQLFNFTFKLKYNGGAPEICQPTAQWSKNIVWTVVYGVDYNSTFLGLIRTGKFSLSQYSQAPVANLDFAETIPSNNVTTPPAGSKKLSFVATVGCERVPGEGVQLQAVSTNQVCFTGTSGGDCTFTDSNTAVCGNGQCESGETQSSCPSDCKPGTTQTYSFNIPNPLKGGASDFSSLVKIIAQWIFNLAIPIAVAMIVYAGILFLTSAGDTSKVTKAKEVLKYAVVGLAIILIGNGFVTLIQSILELGGTGTTQDQGPGLPVGPHLCNNNNVCANGVVGPCRNDSDCQLARPAGAIGNKCSKPGECFTGLTCKDQICQRETGNKENEPCVSTRNCDVVGLTCDRSDPKVIDGQSLGICVQTILK